MSDSEEKDSGTSNNNLEEIAASVSDIFDPKAKPKKGILKNPGETRDRTHTATNVVIAVSENENNNTGKKKSSTTLPIEGVKGLIVKGEGKPVVVEKSAKQITKGQINSKKQINSNKSVVSTLKASDEEQGKQISKDTTKEKKDKKDSKSKDKIKSTKSEKKGKKKDKTTKKK
eukprot:TRINITY_DN10245_c0_g1_i1.p1 TRINITY_DN10245_c0_g1~~TRINITY_DN10245_c0_g1_i1.p1  ORF type:complete len:173 (-),score=41.71 TRINITY_DN10245_c0_g1_i1:8-526(-)